MNKSISSNVKKKNSFYFSVISTNPDVLVKLGKQEVRFLLVKR